MSDDCGYWEGLLDGVEALYQEELAWQEAHWAEQDDFMRSEFLAVSLLDAARWLGKVQDAARAGSLPSDLMVRLHSVEALVKGAEPRIASLRARATGRAA